VPDDLGGMAVSCVGIGERQATSSTPNAGQNAGLMI
jgi:hypothetical protein